MKILNFRLFFTFLISLCLCSCGFVGNEERKEDEAATSSTENSEVMIEAESWNGWSPPKEVSGYSLVNFFVDPFKANNLYSATARYENGEEWLTVLIVDGTTEKGKSEIRDHLEIAELERDYSSEFGYEKTLVRNGLKAKEEYLSPPAGQYLIKFMPTDKYGVSVKSNLEKAEDIWIFIDGLQLEDLN